MASSPHRSPPRRQPPEVRRAQIVEAAAKVFASKGYHLATTREIAATAGVAEGTIYIYFASKRDLLRALLERLSDFEALNRLLETAEDPPEVFLHRLVQQRVWLFRHNAHVVQAVLPELLSQSDLRQEVLNHLLQTTIVALEGYLTRQKAAGRLPRADPHVAARFIQALLLGIMVIEISGDPIVSSPQSTLPDALFAFFLHGMKGEGGGRA